MEFLNEELIYISAGEGPEKLESFEVGRDRWARRVFGTARPAVAATRRQFQPNLFR